MSQITTHVLDTASGVPGAAIGVVLERKTASVGWQRIAEAITDANGRASDLLAADEVLVVGHYRLVFEIGTYFQSRGIQCFFPSVTVSFIVRGSDEHYHVPLLVSPFGYSTYRGS